MMLKCKWCTVLSTITNLLTYKISLIYSLMFFLVHVINSDDNQDEAVSSSVDARGHPLFVMKKKGDRAELSVSSFEHLEAVLRRAGDKKMAEARLCLEGISYVAIT